MKGQYIDGRKYFYPTANSIFTIEPHHTVAVQLVSGILPISKLL